MIRARHKALFKRTLCVKPKAYYIYAVKVKYIKKLLAEVNG